MPWNTLKCKEGITVVKNFQLEFLDLALDFVKKNNLFNIPKTAVSW